MLNATQKDYLQTATDRYTEALPGNEKVTAYLANRGITPDLANTYRLGVVGDDPMIGHDNYVGWISIPFITPSGVVAIKFRQSLDDVQPKYLSDGETRMYNVTALHHTTDQIAVCEGELDTIILDGAVGVPAVGVPGVSNWKKHYPRVFEGYERVFVFADNDTKEDGSNPGMELGKRICREVPQAVIVSLPKGMDVTDTYLTEGKQFLLDLIGK